MSLDLNAIAERADRATKGPWHVEYFGDRGYPQRIGNDSAIIVADTHWGGGGLAPDAEFIAHAREDVPALLAEVERLRQELTDLGLREQWAALYADGTWTSGETESMAEAQEIVTESRLDPQPRLARRWVSDWQIGGAS